MKVCNEPLNGSELTPISPIRQTSTAPAINLVSPVRELISATHGLSWSKELLLQERRFSPKCYSGHSDLHSHKRISGETSSEVKAHFITRY